MDCCAHIPAPVLPRAHGIEVALHEAGVTLDGRITAEFAPGYMAHYSRFIMDTLLKHPSVQDCKTSFVLDRVKATTAVPV